MTNRKWSMLLLLFCLVIFKAMPVFAFAVGDPYEVYHDIPSYSDSYSAAAGTASTGVRAAGTYFIYKTNIGMLNISQKAGTAGFWMDPNDNQPISTEPGPVKPDTPMVTDRYVSLRSGPSKTYTLLRTLAPGTKLLAGQATGSYTSVNWNGQSGYVYTAYLIKPDSVPQVPEPAPEPERKLMITDRFASMRSGPARTYSLIKTLSPGTQVQAGQPSGSYTSVIWNGQSGYVYTDYLVDPDSQSYQELKITGEVTFRSGPGTGYAMIGKIPSGTIVLNLADFSGTYIKISHKGTPGWISSYFIDAVSPYYKDGIIIANKRFPLPASYVPGTSDDVALGLMSKMRQTYRTQTGRSLEIISGYRSYSTQKAIFERNQATYGFTRANTFSARPGYSEHQTGLAFDLNGVDSLTRLKSSFQYTPEYKWLMENAHKYGFILRYPQGKSTITGYIFEPWHFRYLGPVLAAKVRASGLTLEEYLSID